jgi:hypothetical protein
MPAKKSSLLSPSIHLAGRILMKIAGYDGENRANFDGAIVNEIMQRLNF